MSSTTADYIVVGGGLAGCVIASRLSQSEKKPSVILVEAGPDPSGKPNTDTILNGLSLLGGELDHAFQSAPVPTTANRQHFLPAGKVLGGGSILNFGGWLRADVADYDAWGEAVGDRSWSYEGLKPWLDKVESHLGAATISSDPNRIYPLRNAVKTAWDELGSQPAEEAKGSISGIVEVKENTQNGLRQPSYAAYPLERVTVMTNTVVHRVNFSGKQATGILLVDGREITAQKEVIITAGAYRTPQVLLLSGIGPPDVLSSHGIPVVQPSLGVGKNLFDHFAIYLAFRLRDPSKGYALGSSAFNNPSFFKGLPYDWAVSEQLPAEKLDKVESGGAFHNRNLYEVLVVYVPPGIPGIPVDGTHIATSTMLLLPTSRGTVTIKSTDPNDQPEIQPNYLATELDREVIAHAARRTLDALLGTEALKPIVEGETPPSGEGLEGLKPLTVDVSDSDLHERILKTGMQHHHSGGTAAMGSVVDVDGKVKGVERLRVADGSVLPVPLGGHPQATLYAVAEKLADAILEQL
ncbi:GMC oxidoreductase [Periconia macrospinosa]|uniref:GMC oxidoreductase n=1 Tax=Periconia macrospinosa TaxID=97972 RepID=A0A2V1DXC4_9PLEO|nr:GMC oxidoreductase [Periconia macrospinosa]